MRTEGERENNGEREREQWGREREREQRGERGNKNGCERDSLEIVQGT